MNQWIATDGRLIVLADSVIEDYKQIGSITPTHSVPLPKGANGNFCAMVIDGKRLIVVTHESTNNERYRLWYSLEKNNSWPDLKRLDWPHNMNVSQVNVFVEVCDLAFLGGRLMVIGGFLDGKHESTIAELKVIGEEQLLIEGNATFNNDKNIGKNIALTNNSLYFPLRNSGEPGGGICWIPKSDWKQTSVIINFGKLFGEHGIPVGEMPREVVSVAAAIVENGTEMLYVGFGQVDNIHIYRFRVQLKGKAPTVAYDGKSAQLPNLPSALAFGPNGVLFSSPINRGIVSWIDKNNLAGTPSQFNVHETVENRRLAYLPIN